MIFVVDLESVPTRYTCQWKTAIPAMLKSMGLEYTVIEGRTDIPSATTPGAFLNFGGTNIYKSNQVEKISELFVLGQVKAGDQFLFTDAWHPGVINLKYMSSLLNIPVKVHGLWHAGSYDPQDFLGRLVGDVPWVRNAERSFYDCIDYNWFATEYHMRLHADVLFDGAPPKTAFITGWPFEYLEDLIRQDAGEVEKENIILYPHRIAPEKQPEIFRDLANTLPQYQWVVCQDTPLSKQEYHKLIAKSKIVFSANLQETLGISPVEGLCVGAIPMVPDRLSYSEMYSAAFKYPSEWTSSFESYVKHKDLVVEHIVHFMENFDAYADQISIEKDNIVKKFFNATSLYAMLAENENQPL